MGKTKPSWPISYFDKPVPWWRKLYLKVQASRDVRAIVVKDIAKERKSKERPKPPPVHLKKFFD